MHQRAQLRAVDRLGQHLDGAKRQSDAALGKHRDHDYRNVAQLGVGLERGQNIPAVRLGHQNVERDRVWPHHTRKIERLGAARGMNEAVSGAFQIGRQQVAGGRIVVDDQHRGGMHLARGVDGFDLRLGRGTVRQGDGEGRTLAGLARDGDVAAQ